MITRATKGTEPSVAIASGPRSNKRVWGPAEMQKAPKHILLDKKSGEVEEHGVGFLQPIHRRPGSHLQTALPIICVLPGFMVASTAFLNIPGDFDRIWMLLK